MVSESSQPSDHRPSISEHIAAFKEKRFVPTIAALATELDRSTRMVSDYLATGMREVCEVDGWGYDVQAALDWMADNLQIRNAPSSGHKQQTYAPGQWQHELWAAWQGVLKAIKHGKQHAHSLPPPERAKELAKLQTEVAAKMYSLDANSPSDVDLVAMRSARDESRQSDDDQTDTEE